MFEWMGNVSLFLPTHCLVSTASELTMSDSDDEEYGVIGDEEDGKKAGHATVLEHETVLEMDTDDMDDMDDDDVEVRETEVPVFFGVG